MGRMTPGAVVTGTSLLAEVDESPDVAVDGVVAEVVEADITLPVEPGRRWPLVAEVTEAVPLFDYDEDGGGGRPPDGDELMEGEEFTGAVPPREDENTPFPLGPVPMRSLEGLEPTGEMERYEEPIPTGGIGDRVEPVSMGGATELEVPVLRMDGEVPPMDGTIPLGELDPVPTGRRDEPEPTGGLGGREELVPRGGEEGLDGLSVEDGPERAVPPIELPANGADPPIEEFDRPPRFETDVLGGMSPVPEMALD